MNFEYLNQMIKYIEDNLTENVNGDAEFWHTSWKKVCYVLDLMIKKKF